MKTYFVIYIIIIVLIEIFYKIRYKNTDKIDTGFTLNYHKLSHRRKVIRNLWFLPLGIITAVYINQLSDPHAEYIFVLLVIGLFYAIIELIFHYYKWKVQERM